MAPNELIAAWEQRAVNLAYHPEHCGGATAYRTAARELRAALASAPAAEPQGTKLGALGAELGPLGTDHASHPQAQRAAASCPSCANAELQRDIARSKFKARADAVDDLAHTVRRLAHALRQAAPSNDLPEKALDYLKRQGLQGSPLRRTGQGADHGIL